MKYTFTKIDSDTTKLSYKDKEFLIKKDVELLSKLESLNVRAKRKMYIDLTKEGITVEDLQVEKHVGNKTYIDKSNIIAMEQDYLDIVSNELLSEITQKYTNMTLPELLQDVEINISTEGAEEQQKFILDFLKALREEKNPSVKIEEVV